VTFGMGLSSCLDRLLYFALCISAIDYYWRHAVFQSLRVHSIYWVCIGFVLFIVLWHIAHAVFLPLLPCKEPPCDDVEAEKISQVS
jgi:hypothetical protein